MKTTLTFAERIKTFEHFIDIRTAFDDFLTLTIAAFGQSPKLGKSYDEELYLKTMDKYKNDPVRFEFTKLLSDLIVEMTERLDSDTGWDILGEFYEQHLQRKGLSQFFTPWPICKFMAQSTFDALTHISKDKPLRVLDPSCGSGRMLLASSRACGRSHEYFGVDLDQTCVKMTALNMFLSGMFSTETLCANTLLPIAFNGSYVTSDIPFGVFRIQEKECSRLWHMIQYDARKKEESSEKYAGTTSENASKQGSQLHIFNSQDSL